MVLSEKANDADHARHSNNPGRVRIRATLMLLCLAAFLTYTNVRNFNTNYMFNVYLSSEATSQLMSNQENQQHIDWEINKHKKESGNTTQTIDKATDIKRTKTSSVIDRKANSTDHIRANIRRSKRSSVIDRKANSRNHNRTQATPKSHQDPFYGDFFFSDFKLAWNEMENHKTAGFIGQDAFSASWWQSKSNFLRYDMVEDKSPSPEGASFEVFIINEKNMRITRDWMDLNVEHMSKWWKIILDPSVNKDIEQKYLGRILQIFEDYVYSADRLFFWDSLDNNGSTGNWLEVSQSTIAVIAFMPYGGPGGKDITKWSLSATLMSLVQLGVGRIVVSGEESDEKGMEIIMEAWDEVTKATKDWKTSGAKRMTSIGFCNCGNTTSDWPGSHGSNVPKAALRRLRHIYIGEVGDEDIRNCWGGPTSTIADGDAMDRWKYVFLGEPDLILNTRPSALAKLGNALENEGLLAPHRLQPTPHNADFGHEGWNDSFKFVIPDIAPKFDRVVEIDHYEAIAVGTESIATTSATQTACCDDGNQKPHKEYQNCGNWWWDCGFRSLTRKDPEKIDEAIVLKAHQRNALYPLVRLKRGTGVIFAGSEQGRRCLPSNGACAAKKKTKMMTIAKLFFLLPCPKESDRVSYYKTPKTSTKLAAIDTIPPNVNQFVISNGAFEAFYFDLHFN